MTSVCRLPPVFASRRRHCRPNVTSPQLVIPSAVEGSALRLSPSTDFYRAPASDTQRNHSFSRNGRRVTPGGEAAAIEANVPLPIRCWSSVKVCGGRKAHSRSLGFARDDKGALLMNKLESALDEGSNVPHSSQTRLEWATLQFLGSDQSPLRRICSLLPASRKAEGGPLKPRLA